MMPLNLVLDPAVPGQPRSNNVEGVQELDYMTIGPMWRWFVGLAEDLDSEGFKVQARDNAGHRLGWCRRELQLRVDSGCGLAEAISKTDGCIMSRSSCSAHLRLCLQSLPDQYHSQAAHDFTDDNQRYLMQPLIPNFMSTLRSLQSPELVHDILLSYNYRTNPTTREQGKVGLDSVIRYYETVPDKVNNRAGMIKRLEALITMEDEKWAKKLPRANLANLGEAEQFLSALHRLETVEQIEMHLSRVQWQTHDDSKDIRWMLGRVAGVTSRDSKGKAHSSKAARPLLAKAIFDNRKRHQTIEQRQEAIRILGSAALRTNANQKMEREAAARKQPTLQQAFGSTSGLAQERVATAPYGVLGLAEKRSALQAGLAPHLVDKRLRSSATKPSTSIAGNNHTIRAGNADCALASVEGSASTVSRGTPSTAQDGKREESDSKPSSDNTPSDGPDVRASEQADTRAISPAEAVGNPTTAKTSDVMESLERRILVLLPKRQSSVGFLAVLRKVIHGFVIAGLTTTPSSLASVLDSLTHSEAHLLQLADLMGHLEAMDGIGVRTEPEKSDRLVIRQIADWVADVFGKPDGSTGCSYINVLMSNRSQDVIDRIKKDNNARRSPNSKVALTGALMRRQPTQALLKVIGTYGGVTRGGIGVDGRTASSRYTKPRSGLIGPVLAAMNLLQGAKETRVTKWSLALPAAQLSWDDGTEKSVSLRLPAFLTGTTSAQGRFLRQASDAEAAICTLLRSKADMQLGKAIVPLNVAPPGDPPRIDALDAVRQQARLSEASAGIPNLITVFASPPGTIRIPHDQSPNFSTQVVILESIVESVFAESQFPNAFPQVASPLLIDVDETAKSAYEPWINPFESNEMTTTASKILQRTKLEPKSVVIAVMNKRVFRSLPECKCLAVADIDRLYRSRMFTAWTGAFDEKVLTAVTLVLLTEPIRTTRMVSQRSARESLGRALTMAMGLARAAQSEPSHKSGYLVEYNLDHALFVETTTQGSRNLHAGLLDELPRLARIPRSTIELHAKKNDAHQIVTTLPARVILNATTTVLTFRCEQGLDTNFNLYTDYSGVFSGSIEAILYRHPTLDAIWAYPINVRPTSDIDTIKYSSMITIGRPLRKPKTLTPITWQPGVARGPGLALLLAHAPSFAETQLGRLELEG